MFAKILEATFAREDDISIDVVGLELTHPHRGRRINDVHSQDKEDQR